MCGAIKHYVIIDRHTMLQVGRPYTNRSRARARVDKLDNQYGAYRYSVHTVYVGEGQE